MSAVGIDRFPLRPGSPAAVALHRMWSGEGTQTVVVGAEVVGVAATVAMHVLLRTGAEVAVQVSLAWCNQFAAAVDPRGGETHRVLTGSAASDAPLSERRDALRVFSNGRFRGISVVVTLDGQTAAASFLTGNEHQGVRLGPMPLDIAIAGEQA